MKVLKNALGSMNDGVRRGLKLVTAGSDPYKQVRLLYANSAPFREACLAPLPRLDVGYLRYESSLVERIGGQPLQLDKLALAFSLFDYQPPSSTRRLLNYAPNAPQSPSIAKRGCFVPPFRTSSTVSSR